MPHENLVDEPVLSDMIAEDAALAAFLPIMREKLFKNRHKSGWKKVAPHLLLARVCDELAEIIASMQPEEKAQRTFDFAMRDLQHAAMALRTFGEGLQCHGGAKPIAFEAADVANMVMMVADVMGGLPLNKEKEPGIKTPGARRTRERQAGAAGGSYVERLCGECGKDVGGSYVTGAGQFFCNDVACIDARPRVPGVDRCPSCPCLRMNGVCLRCTEEARKKGQT